MPARSWRFFQEALRPDAEPCNSTTSEEGLHLGAMAGSLDVLQRHYLGIGFEIDGIRLDPAPPAELGPVRLGFQYRREDFLLEWTGSRLRLEAASSNAASVTVRRGAKRETLRPGTSIAF
jgi:trehalose/maltose hydrolase-like predicted phosphorylase